MRIAMIGHKRIPSREGGVEIVVEELSVRFVKAGHVVHAYNRMGSHIAGKDYNGANKKTHAGIRLITIPTLQNSMLNAFIYSLLATIRALFGRYDILHYHAEGPCAMLWLASIFGKQTVATIHGLDWKRGKWGGFASKYLKFGEKMAVKHANKIIVLSSNHQHYFMEKYNRDTVLIPNGVNEHTPAQDDNEIKSFRINKGDYILFLARIVPEKGLHYLIEAYKGVKTDKKLVVAGSGSHSDEYVEQITRLADNDPRIVMTGFVQGALLEQLYSHAYLYILPSDVEGMPLSLLEAMSYGCCCVVSDIPENMEVTEGKACCFRKGDADDLREKLTWLLREPEAAERYRRDACAYVCSRYNWDDLAKQTLEVYRKVCENYEM